MLWLTLPFLAAADDADGPASVTEALSGGTLDWSALRLEVSVRSQRATGAWQDRRLQEQDALDQLSDRITALASTVPITSALTAGDLLSGDDVLAARLQDGLRRWVVEETRYYNSGGVELVGTLDLRSWLWPALAAQVTDPPTAEPSSYTGLVIDARGQHVSLSLSPTVRTPTGQRLLYPGAISEDTARASSPVLYVSDPSDPRAAARAGQAPHFARISATEDGEMILDPASAAQCTADRGLPALIAAGKVVVVVDP